MAKKKNIEHLAESLPLVAIDLGSSGIRAMAARRVAGDKLHILGVEQSSQFQCVDRGVVVQSSNAGFMIGQVLKLLANRIGVNELPAAFVTLGGKSMKIYNVRSKRDQVRKREVSRQLLDELQQECKDKIEARNAEAAVLGLVPSYYVLDGVEQEEVPAPEQRAVMVEANYIAFVGKKELDSQVRKSFDQAGKSIEQTFVRPDALLSAFAATDGYEVLRDGCAVIDFGAQTTTLSVFKQSQYLCTKVVPQGGYHISRVLEDQGMSFAYAEKLKCQHGFASPEFIEKQYTMLVPAPGLEVGKLRISNTEVAMQIGLKLEEILGPILDELRDYENRISVVYLTGGGSMLNGLIDYVAQRTKLKVMYGAHDRVLDVTTPEEYCEPRYSALVGALLLGADYRDTHPGQKINNNKLVDKVSIALIDIFSNQQQ
jgi:cell division protein FtsA